jgi:hypothetical protein
MFYWRVSRLLKYPADSGVSPDLKTDSANPLGVFLNDNQGKPDIRAF